LVAQLEKAQLWDQRRPQLAKGADILVTEVTFVSAEEAKAQQVRTGQWERETPEEQASYLRHNEEEHLRPAEVGKWPPALASSC
jgi:ribonuclease BN (tRNA processing enzyme)